MSTLNEAEEMLGYLQEMEKALEEGNFSEIERMIRVMRLKYEHDIYSEMKRSATAFASVLNQCR